MLALHWPPVTYWLDAGDQVIATALALLDRMNDDKEGDPADE